jgi:hypothetical protein
MREVMDAWINVSLQQHYSSERARDVLPMKIT